MINISEKLIRCPKGFKLYSPLFGEVTLDQVNYSKGIIVTTYMGYNKVFNDFGQYSGGYVESECMLFPSKEQRDWSKFNYLEEGHRVMVSDKGKIWSLYNYYKERIVIPIGGKLEDGLSWEYIVPIERFDFSARDITINCQKSIV